MQPGKTRRWSRRDFVKTAAVTAAATSVMPRFVFGAENDKPLKIGVVGCGGRGYGAINDALRADKNVRITALADIFEDRVNHARNSLKDRSPVEEKNCFVGFDAYKKLLETDVDYVILATPPYYRPEHFAACIAAGKHVFTEKPVAVDPVGIRKFLEAGQQAEAKKLSVVAGTQRRHQGGYIETIRRIHDGAIGKIVAAQCYWNGGQLWYKRREEGWSEMDWMHRDWVNWAWLSGDHIVEQHVHNLDVVNWVIGKNPVSVVAMGSRHRRVTGDQYDNFAADFEYPDNVHVLSMCRQISGCADDVSERVVGEKGVSNCNGWISTIKEKIEGKGAGAYEQEHIDLIASIRQEQGLNEARNVAYSTLCAIMARTSAYTGKKVTWDEMMNSDMVLSKPDYELTDENRMKHIPVPGKA